MDSKKINSTFFKSSLMACLLLLCSVWGNSVYALSDKTDFVSNNEVSIENSYADQAFRTEIFRVTGPVRLDVSTTGGHIDVIKGSSSEVQVRLIVRQGYSFWGGSNFRPEDYKIIIEQDGNAITAVVERLRQSSRGGNQPSFSFEISVPAETSTDLRTSGGHITIKGIEGNQQVRTSGGHLTFSDMAGVVNARTSGGHINISNFSGKLESLTSGGHITLENIRGEVEVRTSGGNIRADRLEGSFSASTSGGNISCSVINQISGLSLRTSGGNIRASVPANIDYNLNLRGSSVNVVNMNNFSGTTERNRVIGKIGDGGHAIDLSTSGGSVMLTLAN
ncbi:MAG: DUF4097 domain-containing protein [Balneolales bacterium]|nr:DUF4097 domain-containing protein [Balneolales bacterium]